VLALHRSRALAHHQRQNCRHEHRQLDELTEWMQLRRIR
jgi:hypothetical protein